MVINIAIHKKIISTKANNEDIKPKKRTDHSVFKTN